MNIYIDIDGVIADCVEALIPRLNDHYGKMITIDDIVHYDLAEVLQVAREEMDDFFELVGEEGLYRELVVIEGAKEALSHLAPKHSIKLITFRLPKLRDDTEHWLKINGIPYDEVIYIGNQDKAHYIGECDVFIEDSLDAAYRVANKGIDVLLFDYPWNRCVDGYCETFGGETANRIQRVYAWSDIMDYMSLRERTAECNGGRG